ncbi:hypothetical protein WA026_015783 [Henosepilachna vigintioctopunctata]|uniref:Uncharacterized protein n=1 Tax=Henosepilachna vigintioctopunctata TaxID=420089 RepID=A0AAW1US11_9CUCU
MEWKTKIMSLLWKIQILVVTFQLPSHYCRQSTSELYLEPVIQSKAQLYRLYSDYLQSKIEPAVSRKLFESILFEENIGLFSPKKKFVTFAALIRQVIYKTNSLKNT